MPTLADIQIQIKALPHRYIFWTRKEIRALPEILRESESILALTSGIMEGNTWLAVCTNERLIFLNRGMILGLRQVQIPLDRIQSIDHEFTIVFGSIRVWDGASYFTLKMVLQGSIEPFVSATQRAAQDYKLLVQQKIHSGTTLQAVDVASQLERLAVLRDKGVLTEAEFQQQKSKILAAN